MALKTIPYNVTSDMLESSETFEEFKSIIEENALDEHDYEIDRINIFG